MDAIKSMILTLFLHIANVIVVLISAGTCFLSMLTNVICVSHTPHTQILILSSSLIGAGIIIYHSVVVLKAFCTCYFCSILFLWPLHYIRIELLRIVYVYCCHLGFSEGRKLGQRCTCWWLTSIFLFFFHLFFFGGDFFRIFPLISCTINVMFVLNEGVIVLCPAFYFLYTELHLRDLLFELFKSCQFCFLLICCCINKKELQSLRPLKHLISFCYDR